MNKPFLFIFILFISGQNFCQRDFKQMHHSFVKVQKGLYAEKYELSNKEYLQFINDLRESGQLALLKEVEVDTMNWDMPYRYSSKFQEHYHDHPVYQDYPVVNVSHQAAMQYCQWLTEKYHASNGRKFKEVRFRLPTAKEWELAAQGGDSSAIFPWEGTFVFNDQGNYQSNVREVIFDSFDFGVVWYDIEVIEPVKSFQKNTFGLYNMCGNVAEMIADSTLVKGGSWFDFSDRHEIKKSQPYDGGSNPTVGFRVFMEVIQKQAFYIRSFKP